MALLQKESFVVFPGVTMSCPLTDFHQLGARIAIRHTQLAPNFLPILHSNNIIFSNTLLSCYSLHKKIIHISLLLMTSRQDFPFLGNLRFPCTVPLHLVSLFQSSLNIHNLYSSQDTVHSSSFLSAFTILQEPADREKIVFTTYITTFIYHTILVTSQQLFYDEETGSEGVCFPRSCNQQQTACNSLRLCKAFLPLGSQHLAYTTAIQHILVCHFVS